MLAHIKQNLHIPCYFGIEAPMFKRRFKEGKVILSVVENLKAIWFCKICFICALFILIISIPYRILRRKYGNCN